MKRLTGLNGHLSNRDSSLTSCQKSSYLHINRSKIEPLPQGYEIYSFYILFLGHHYYIFRLPWNKEGDFQRNYAFSPIIFCPAQAQEPMSQSLWNLQFW